MRSYIRSRGKSLKVGIDHTSAVSCNTGFLQCDVIEDVLQEGDVDNFFSKLMEIIYQN